MFVRKSTYITVVDELAATRHALAFGLIEATGQSPERLAAQLEEKVAGYAAIEARLDADIAELEALLEERRGQKAHVSYVATNTQTARRTLAGLPNLATSLDPSIMDGYGESSDMPAMADSNTDEPPSAPTEG